MTIKIWDLPAHPAPTALAGTERVPCDTSDGGTAADTPHVTLAQVAAYVRSLAPYTAATLTVPADKRGRFEHVETIINAAVSASSRIVVVLAGTDDDDENSSEMIDLLTLVANPGTGQFDIVATFSHLTSGPILVQYQVT